MENQESKNASNPKDGQLNNIEINKQTEADIDKSSDNDDSNYTSEENEYADGKGTALAEEFPTEAAYEKVRENPEQDAG